MTSMIVPLTPALCFLVLPWTSCPFCPVLISQTFPIIPKRGTVLSFPWHGGMSLNFIFCVSFILDLTSFPFQDSRCSALRKVESTGTWVLSQWTWLLQDQEGQLLSTWEFCELALNPGSMKRAVVLRKEHLHHGNCKHYKSGPCGVVLLLERSRRSLPAPHPVLLPPHPSSSDILLLPALSLATTQLLSFGRYLWHSHSRSSCVAWEIWTGAPSSIWQKAQSASSWDQPLEGELGSPGRKRGSEKRDRRGCALHNGRERSREGTLGKVFKTNLPAVLGTEPVSSPVRRVWGKKAHKALRRELFSYVRHFPSDVPFLLGSHLWTGTLVVMESIKGSQKRPEKYRGTHLRCSLLSMRPWMNDSDPPLLTFTLSIPTPLNNLEPGDATASSHFFPSFLQETPGHWPRRPAVWCCDGLGSSSINSKSHQHTFIVLICLQSTFLFISSFDPLFA